MGNSSNIMPRENPAQRRYRGRTINRGIPEGVVMSKIIKTGDLHMEIKSSPIPEYSWNTSEDLAELVNLTDFCCNIRSLEKGKISYPYHFHHNAEEMFVILSGSGELRTPEGIHKIKTGEIALFEKGESGAHQLYNPNEELLVYIDLRSLNKVDICEYPDTGKVNILPKREIFYKGNDVGYFDGEENISEILGKIKSGE